jgi:hypothetical protein
MTLSRLSAKRARTGIRRTCVLTAALTIAALTAQPGAQDAPVDLTRNFDIRIDKDARGASEYLEKLETGRELASLGQARLDARAQALAQMLAGDAVEVAFAPETDALEIVAPRAGGGFLTGPSRDRAAALRSFVAGHAAAFGITATEVATLDVVADYENPAGNLAWVELEQKINGIPVFRGYIRGGFTARGELIRTTGQLAAGLANASLPTAPRLTAADAIERSAAHAGWTVPAYSIIETSTAQAGRARFSSPALHGDARAWHVYFPFRSGVARLAWATEIVGDEHAYLIVLDAEDGTVLFRKNLTSYQSQAVTYNIYNDDSPAPASPSTATPDNHLQAPFIPRVNHTLIGSEAPYTFNNLGWMADGVNDTQGNNVIAGLDRVSPDGVDATVSGTSFRVFNYSYNPETDEALTPNYQGGEIANMFYWVNRFHDETYLLGFTEQARNFQQDNFGRGGTGGDRISAEGQDSSGTNNANFTTGPDGGTAKLQMFLWTGPTPDRSGGLDRDIVVHELTHGLSNRLHANATGLTSNMSQGMGEGWSDFYARALFATADEPVDGIYTMSGWATHLADAGYTDNYYYGIRRFPYAVKTAVGGPMNRPHNPLTFADIDSTQADLTDGAYPPNMRFSGPVVDQVHNIGQVWAMMLFEVRARFIARLGFAEGNRRILQYVTDGMKANSTNPTFIDARNSILTIARAAGTPADVADIWAGFAARGLGVLASIENPGTGPNSTRVTENFNVPGDPIPTLSINNVTVAEGDAGTTTATFTVTLTHPGTNTPTVSFTTADGTATSAVLFTSPGGAAIPGSGTGSSTGAPAAPYPLQVNVSGLSGTIVNLAVRLNGLSHTFPDDIDMMLAGPAGQNVMLMSDAGFSTDLVDANLTFATGGTPLPDGGTIVSNTTYTPADFDPGENLVAPAPPGPYSTDLSVFNGSNPNGTWSLFVQDDAGGDVGALAGYTLLITTSTSSDYQAASGTLDFPPGTTTRQINVIVNGDAVPEPHETFSVILALPSGAALDPDDGGVGIGTVLDDDTTTPQAPNGLHVASMVGNLVTLRWTPANLGSPATGWVVEGGIAPGSVLASLPTGTTAPIFTFAAPTGSFFVRVHQVSGGAKSPASNEIPLHVNVPVPPSAPEGLLATVSGTALNLAWRNTFAGGPSTSLLLDVTGSLTATLPIAATNQLSFPTVPGGTYTLALRARNAGGISGPSNPVTITVPGACTGAPLPPENFLFYKVGNVVTAVWDPASSGGAPAGYVINVSGTFNLSLSTAQRGISSPVPPGTYTMSVLATNPCGASEPTDPQTVTVP